MSLEAELPGDISHSVSGTGAPAVHVETQLSAQGDIAAARQFFQPATHAALPSPSFTGLETAAAGKAAVVAAATGTESAIIAKSVAGIAAAGAEAAALGAHAMAGAGAAVGAAEISPMIQLIMRLPGLGGVAQSFFEWLGALFAPGNLVELFNPTHWAQLGGSIQSSISHLAGQAGHGLIGAEHFNVPLSMLPANAHFLRELGMNSGLSDLSRISTQAGSGLSTNGLTSLNLREHMNISGPFDLKKPQFEMAQQANPHSAAGLDGKISGPEMNSVHEPSHLAGTQRLFSDQISRSNSLLANANNQTGTFVSNSTSPAGTQGALNISSNQFQAQQVSAGSAEYRLSDGTISGPSMSGSNNIGYQMSDAVSAGADRSASLAPSGAVSDTLGGKELLAANDNPSFGNSYFRPASSGYPSTAGSESSVSSSGVTELKAEPMSLLKKANPTPGTTPARGAVDQIGHQSKTSIQAHTNNNAPAQAQNHATKPVMDQVSHRGSHGGESAVRRIASKQVSGDPPQAVKHTHHSAKHSIQSKPKVENVEAKAAAQPEGANYQEQLEAGQTGQAGATDRVAMESGGEATTNYTVARGDNLWDIARKQLGDGKRWSEIYELNKDLIGTNPDLIHTGIDLKLPGAESTPVADAGNYTVQPGDNLWDIAKDKLGDGSRWGEIYDANKSLIGENPRLIFSGQELQMPGGQSLISQASPSAALPQTDPSLLSQTQSMTPQAVTPQIDPQLLGSQASPQMMAPQASAQGPSYFSPQADMSSQAGMPQQPVYGGPGAASAATLDPNQMPGEEAVSPSLAPDLSFLYNNKK